MQPALAHHSLFFLSLIAKTPWRTEIVTKQEFTVVFFMICVVVGWMSNNNNENNLK